MIMSARSMLTVFKYAGPPPGTALDSTMNLADGGLDSLESSITSAADKRRLDESPAPRRKRMTRGCCTALEMFLTLASKCGEPSYELSWGGSRGGRGWKAGVNTVPRREGEALDEREREGEGEEEEEYLRDERRAVDGEEEVARPHHGRGAHLRVQHHAARQRAVAAREGKRDEVRPQLQPQRREGGREGDVEREGRGGHVRGPHAVLPLAVHVRLAGHVDL